MRTRHLLWLLLPLACTDNPASETTGTTSTGSSGQAESGTTAGPLAPLTTSGEDTRAEQTTGDPTTSGGTSTSTANTTSTGETSTGEDSTGETTSDTGAATCPGAPLPAGDHTIEIQHDGNKRTAILHVPPGLDPQAAAPLVFNFHGYTMTGAGQVTFSGMNTLADSEGFLVVYPDGIDTSWNAGACCGNAASQGIDDVGYVRALHAHLATQVCYDAKRVYATGMSNGGFMSNRLACEAADMFAAVAPVSAVNGMDACTPSRPIPVLAFNGTNDLLVSYNGLLYIGVAQSFAEWGERDGCVGAPVPGTTSGAASCETYDDCADDVHVTQCTIEGMGHCWPGQPTCAYGTANTDLNANVEMWGFFQQYALP